MKKTKGFSLLEVAVALGIFIIITSVAFPMILKIFQNKRIKSTIERLELISDAARTYYDKNNKIPTLITDLNEIVPSYYIKDSWNRDLSYYKNIVYNNVTYQMLFISSGKNAKLDSTAADNSTFVPAGDDLYVLISINDLIFKKEDSTRKKEAEIAKRIHNYYKQYGTVISSLDELNLDSDLLKDDFDQDFLYFTNVVYDNTTYDALILSTGKNLILDSTVVSGGNFIPAADDIYYLINVQEDDSAYQITINKLNKANAAYNACITVTTDSNYTGPAVDCTNITDLILYDYLEGKNSYDYWGLKFLFDTVNSTFYSAGPDLQYGTSDDIYP